jgi:hypothetical protein
MYININLTTEVVVFINTNKAITTQQRLGMTP